MLKADRFVGGEEELAVDARQKVAQGIATESIDGERMGFLDFDEQGAEVVGSSPGQRGDADGAGFGRFATREGLGPGGDFGGSGVRFSLEPSTVVIALRRPGGGEVGLDLDRRTGVVQVRALDTHAEAVPINQTKPGRRPRPGPVRHGRNVRPGRSLDGPKPWSGSTPPDVQAQGRCSGIRARTRWDRPRNTVRPHRHGAGSDRR